MISLVASLANLDKLPTEAREAMQGLGATVRATLVTALSKALIVAEKVVKSRWPSKSNGDPQTTGYAGQASDIKRWRVPTAAKAETHTLHTTTGTDNPTGTSGQASNNNNTAPATGTVIYRGVKEVPLEKQLQEWNEQTKEKDSDLKKKILAATTHLKEKLKPLVSVIAKAFKNFNAKLEALKKIRDNKDSKPQQITTAESESAAALASLANAQQAAEPALQQQATLVQACEADAAGCFAAGTKLWTPQGYQNVEDLRETDLVYSRNEYDPSGAIEAKPIEKAFRRLAEVVHLHLRGPNGYLVAIRTTGEHPFYAFNKGWTPTKELTSEDWVLTEGDDWAKVEEIFATGDMEVVYNLRVAEWHTYFVGDEGWSWTAWAHNAYLTAQNQADLRQALIALGVRQDIIEGLVVNATNHCEGTGLLKIAIDRAGRLESRSPNPDNDNVVWREFIPLIDNQFIEWYEQNFGSINRTIPLHQALGNEGLEQALIYAKKRLLWAFNGVKNVFPSGNWTVTPATNPSQDGRWYRSPQGLVDLELALEGHSSSRTFKEGPHLTIKAFDNQNKQRGVRKVFIQGWENYQFDHAGFFAGKYS